jgi:hypothetical protein
MEYGIPRSMIEAIRRWPYACKPAREDLFQAFIAGMAVRIRGWHWAGRQPPSRRQVRACVRARLCHARDSS